MPLTQLNFPKVKEDKYEGSNILLSCLLTAYPENGLEIYRKYDYWTCKELLDINSSGKENPANKIQLENNDRFNEYLDTFADKRITWQYKDKKYSLRQIQKLAHQQVDI